MIIAGRCHCGNIAFDLDWTPEPAEIPARACTCSFCVKHGGVWTSCPTGSLAVAVWDRAAVSRYRFGTKTAEFHVCSTCGVVPLATSTIDGTLYAVVNVNTFDDMDPARLRRVESHLGNEDEATRLARRARNWIPRVVFGPVRG